MDAFDDLAAISPLAIWPGIVARIVDGERLTLAVVELDPDSLVAEHSHDNEQLGIVLRGSVIFRVGNDERELGPGGTWRIEAGTPHTARAGPEGAVVVDVFSPHRADWRSAERLDARRPHWP